MKKRVLSLFLAITLCLSLTPTGALAEESLPEQTVAATQETETPTPVPQKEEPLPEQTVAATQETETPTLAPQKEESLPEQTVAATQETETPTPAPQKEEPTAPAKNGADENASPANPEENPTENTPAAAEKNSADEEPGKEPAAATGRDESKADGSPSDDDAAKVQNQLVMAAAAGPGEPTMMGQNDLLPLADEGQTPANAQSSEGGGIYVSEGDTRTEIRCTSKPTSIQRSYDGTTDGGTIPIDLTFTDDGTNEINLKEGTGFTSTKTFDSADAGWRTVTVEIELIGDAAAEYKLKAGEEKFTIGGYINKAHPDLTVSLSKTACTVGEKILPLLSVEGAPEDAAVTYYYTQYKSIAGDSDYEGNAIPAIDESTAISSLDEEGNNTYYVYAKTAATQNYEEGRSTTVELTVNEAVVEAASVTKADGTDGGTYESLPAALNAAQNGDTVKLLANHTTNWSDVEAGEYDTLAVVKKALTLDLNGWTIDYLKVGEVVSDEAGGIIDSYDGNLTVVESSQGTTGKIIDLNFIKGTLDIQGGAIGADPSSTEGNSGQLTCNGNSGNATISGGTVLGLEVSEGDTVAVNGGTVYGVTVRDGASVIVSGGSMHEGNWFNDGTLTITGGTFDSVSFRNNGGTIAIRGGTFGEITNENASGTIPLMSLLADGYAFYGKEADEKYTVLQDSRKTTLENVKVMDHTDHAFLNGACIACGALTCDKSNNGEEGGCIAHVTIENYTWHLKTLDQIAYHLSAVGQWSSNYETVTVEFLSDVTTDTPFRINQCLTLVTLDLNGHTISGELSSSPVAEVNYEYGTQRVILQNGTIENTAKNGTALQLSGGATTLENVNVKGDLVLTYNFAGRASYIPTFLGGGSFTRICPAANDVGGTWSKQLKDMLGTGCCFLDSAGSRINAEQWFGSDGYSKIKKLIDVRVKACDHKDENGSYTLFEDATMSYGSLAKRCKICGNLCPHDEITGDQNPACVACGLPIVIKTTNLLNGKAIGPWYYTGLNDAMYEILHVNKGRRPTLELLADTESDSTYEWLTNDYDGIFIDLAGHTLTLTGDQNKASYWVTIQNTSDTHAEVRGTVNVYHKDSRSKLVILDTDNNLTIETVKFVDDGTAELAGGSFGKITVPAGKTLASLLVSGYYFADSNSATDKPAALYDTTGKALTVLTEVTVKPCSHDEAIYVPVDGGAWKCFCGQKTFVASVTKDDTTTLYTDLQEAFSAADGGTVKLMANERGDVTVNTDQPLTLDLNGYNIYKLTVNSKITLKDSSGGTGKIAENLIVAADGLTVGDLLEDGYAFRSCSDNSWYGETLKTVGNARVQQVPITSVTLDALNAKDNTAAPTTMVYGTTGGVKLSASCNILNLTTPDCKWYEVGGSLIPIDNEMGMNYFLPDDLIAGEHTYRVTFISDGYEKSAEITITVEKADLSEAEITFPYGNEAAFNYVSATGVPTFVVTYKGQTLEKDVDFTITGGDSTYDVGPCTLTIKATDNGNYTGSKSAEWTVRPLKVAASVGDIIKTYDGTANLPENTKITLMSADSYYTGTTLRLAEGTDYEVLDAKYDSADASETEKDISFTIKLKNEGYVFEDGTKEKAFTLKGSETDKTFKINKAAIASDTQLHQTVFNDLAKTYEINLKQFLDTILPEGGKYGDIQYGQPRVFMGSDYYPAGGATIENDKLSLSINKAASSKQGDEIGTVTVEVETTNYQPFTLTIHVSVQDKFVPVPAKGNTVSATDITYGQALADSKLTVNGTMQDRNTGAEVKGTFAWTNKDFKPDASDSYEAEWTFTPAKDYEEYATATGTVTVKVNKADPTFTAPTANTLTYTGSEQSLLTAGSTQDGTMMYRLGESGEFVDSIPNGKDAGTYTVYYKVMGDGNHNDTEVQFVSVTIDPLPISLLSVSSISKTYDGSADVTLTADKLTFFSMTAKAMNIKLPDTALTFSDAQFTKEQADRSYLPSPEVGGGKALSFTMTLTSKNYVFEREPEGTIEVSNVFATDDANRFTITKAAAPTMQPIELTVINGLEKTYLVNLPALPTLGDHCKYGSIKYEVCNFDLIGEGGYANSTAMITSNDEFQLAVPAVESQTEGSVGTVGVKITTDNYQDMLLTVEVIAKNKIVPVLDGEITATPITFGQILRVSTITGTMKDDGKTVEGTFEWTDPSTKPDKAGDYQAEWTFTPAEGYEEYATVTGNTTVKVNKAAIPTSAITAPTAQENLTYTGQEQALIIAGIVTDYGTMQYSLTENGKYSQDIPTGTDAGTYTVYYKVVGDENHNDTAPASVAVRIGQKPLPITGVTAESKPYDGTTNADISSVTFDNVTLNRGTDYTVTASFDDAGVGSGKNVTATVTLMGQAAKNYALEQSSFLATASITKAAAPTNIQSGTQTITNGLHKTYSFDLSTLLPKLTAPCDYGTITYDKKVDTNLGVGSFITLVNGKTGELTLEANRSGTDEGQFGTITVTISTSNYQDITLTVNVSAVNQITPVPEDGTINASKITYGQALSDSTITGTMQDDGKTVEGTFEWTDSSTKPDKAGDYQAEWAFTPDESYGGKYTTYTGTATVTVTPKAVTVSITPNGGTYGETITPATVKANDVVGEDTPTITLTYTGTANDGTEYTGTTPPTKAGTYTIKAATTDTNYTLDAKTTTAEFTVAKRRATVTPDNKTKVYEAKDPDLTYAVSGVLDGETLKGITLTRAEGENAGEYAITATADAGANPNYDVTFAEGTLTIEPKSIKGAKVVLGKALTANGAEQTQTVEKVLLDDKELPADSYTVTDNTATAPGRYTLTVTAKGNYTGKIEWTYVIAPAKAEDAPGADIAIDKGTVKLAVKSEGNVPTTTLLTDKAELLAMLVDSGDITADELAQIANGASVDIVLTMKEANVPDEVKAAMAQAAKDYTIGHYLDISLFKYMTVNGSQQADVALHTTKDVLTISVVVPDALINTNSAVNRTYCIVRNHEGTITVLDAAFDAASKTLTFKTDRFSDYAIAYKDTAVPSSGSNPGSNSGSSNSSNDSETKKNEVTAPTPTPTPTPASTSKPSTITAAPQTGDTFHPTLYVVLLVVSLLGLAVVFVCKKRNDK